MAALEEGLLHRREAAAEQAYHQVVGEVGLGLLRPAAVVGLQQRDTDVEKTMIEMQRKAIVHETRSAFQQAMERR